MITCFEPAFASIHWQQKQANRVALFIVSNLFCSPNKCMVLQTPAVSSKQGLLSSIPV